MRCSFSTAVWATCHSSTSSSFRSILIWRSVSYPWRVFKSCSNVSKSALLEVADTVSEHKWSNSVSTQSCLHNASLEAIPTESCKGGLVGNKFLSTNVSSCLVNIGSRINQLNPKLGAYHVASHLLSTVPCPNQLEIPDSAPMATTGHHKSKAVVGWNLWEWSIHRLPTTGGEKGRTHRSTHQPQKEAHLNHRLWEGLGAEKHPSQELVT